MSRANFSLQIIPRHSMNFYNVKHPTVRSRGKDLYKAHNPGALSSKDGKEDLQQFFNISISLMVRIQTSISLKRDKN